VANELVNKDPLLALYLAAEAVARSPDGVPGYDARSSLLAARAALAKGGPALLGSPVSAGDARVLSLSVDGTLLAAGGRDGSIDLIDTVTRRPAGPPVQGHKGGIEDLDFGPDNASLATVGDDGLLQLWPIDGGMIGKPQIIARFDDVVWGVRFDPAGRKIATASEDGTVRLWDPTADAPKRPPLIDRMGDFLTVALSHDGSGLIAGNGEGEIHGWSLPDGAPLFEPIRGVHTSDVWELTIDPTNHVFATSSSDGKSILFTYPAGKVMDRNNAPLAGVQIVREAGLHINFGTWLLMASVPALNASKRSPPQARTMPSAIWLRALLWVHTKRTRVGGLPGVSTGESYDRGVNAGSSRVNVHHWG
jgi:hypothetical protein